jgi:hypothetical protein
MSTFTLGGVVTDGVEERNTKGLWTPEQSELTQQQKERVVREGLRAKHGLGAMAIKCLPEVIRLMHEGKIVLIDDLYSDEERIHLETELGRATLLSVAMTADWDIRVERAINRPHRPLAGATELEERDNAELINLNKAGPIARANITIVNNHDGLADPVGALASLKNEIETRVIPQLLAA